jgi:serine/threonine protein phosphatase PrpC
MNDQNKREPGSERPPVPEAPAAVGAGQWDLEAVKLTDVGRARSHNEDTLDYYVPPDPRQRERKGVICLVADGMGGHQAGEVASQGAVELVIGQYYGDTTHDIGTSLVRAFRAANQLIYDQAQADSSKAGMGTTLVAAVILGRKVYLANVGDSRAYLVNKAGIVQITEDHSWVEEQVRAGLLTQEQAARHPQRNLLTRALGTKPTIEVDLFQGELGEGDTLLMCTDGLTGRVEDREIAAMVREHPHEEAARLLVALANERGGQDNISVLIVGDREETPTVVAPPPVPLKGQSARAFPLVLILVAVAGALVLVLGGLFVVPRLLGSRATPTPTASPVVPSATIQPGVEPTQTMATAPLVVETVPSQIEGTAAPTDAATPSGPTATLAATFTPLPPSATAQPGAQQTATQQPPAAVSTSSDPAPTLLEPASDTTLQGEVTFKWSYASLSPGKAFQVLIWQEGEVQHNGAAAFTDQREQRINVDEVPSIVTGGAGTYFWSVVVVDQASGQRLSPEATARRFAFTGPQPSGGGGSGGGQGGQPPTPRP